MADAAQIWSLTHAERAHTADLLETLTPEQWSQPSLCAGWSVHLAGAHILAGAEQTIPHFVKGFAGSGFRFDVFIDRAAHRLATLEPAEIVRRLRARTSTKNGPPAPPVAMLGEIVVHTQDIARPLGLVATASPAATVACLRMYEGASFPVGGKKRIAGLRLVATDVDWTHGEGAEVTGSGVSLLLAMTGRAVGADELDGPGASTLVARLKG